MTDAERTCLKVSYLNINVGIFSELFDLETRGFGHPGVPPVEEGHWDIAPDGSHPVHHRKLGPRHSRHELVEGNLTPAPNKSFT